METSLITPPPHNNKNCLRRDSANPKSCNVQAHALQQMGRDYQTTGRQFLTNPFDMEKCFSFFISIVGVYLVVGSSQPMTAPNIPTSEMNALYDLYDATNGEDWIWSDNIAAYGIPWNFTDPTVNNPCIDRWQGVNCNFSSPFEIYHVIELSLPAFNLAGTLPDTLVALNQLQALEIGINRLSGTIPDNLGNLTQLQLLDLSGNLLTNTIPGSLSNLSQLQFLNLGYNWLNGTIPAHLCHLIKLEILELDGNLLTGTIPAALSNLTQLQYLALERNQLTGPVPESLGDLMHLQYIILSYNRLNGTIPLSLSDLVQLQYLELQINQLTGTIPAALSKLTKLVYFVAQNNLLTGTIPESLGNIVLLQQLFLNNNQLTGSIPASLGKLKQLQYLLLYNNRLVGSMPETLGGLTRLTYLDVDTNHLTGTIPESLGNLTQLLFLNLDVNQLTGSIPKTLGNLVQLQDLMLHRNHLTGQIPYLRNPFLEQLLLDNNHLTGRVPTLAQFLFLEVVLLHNNQLTGTLDDIFDPSTQHSVATVVLANNQFTGTIPEAVFQLKPLTFVGTSNCFQGPLPISAICNNMNMMSFVIDGMSSASSCRSKLFAGPLSAYLLHHSIGGSIPQCLFQLPQLTTLHLSGNGFTGSLPNNTQLYESLTDLSLSHNALTGTIPDHIQQKHWTNIDLSYNRISGTLLSHFVANGSIGLENNRISGAIPAPFSSLQNISILESNTFECEYDKSNLPEHDPNRSKYQCGSNSFNALFYVWLGAVFCAVVLVGYYGRKYHTIRTIISSDAALHNTNLYSTLSTIVRLSLGCTFYSIVVLLPLYTACSVSYGTQTYEYAYQVSAVYMSGVVPFALDWCFWWLLLLGMKVMLFYAPSITSRTKAVRGEMSKRSMWETMTVFVPYLLIDVIVVAGVNAAYVYVAVYRSSSLLLVVQTLLSIFKVVWGRVALPNLLRVLTRGKQLRQIQLFTQVVVNLLNIIVIPCLIVAVVSPNCFYNALVAAPAVSATVSYAQCVIIIASTGECYQYQNVPVFTTFEPPFTNNYQCSSSLITYYSPAFVSMCIVSTFVAPLAQHVCVLLHKRATVGTYWYRLLDRCLPRLLTTSDYTANTDTSYFNIGGLVTALIGTLGLILTFGVMFPPLCIALSVSICATVFIFRQNVSNFIRNCSEQNKAHVLTIISLECNSVDAMLILKGSVWLLITVSCWFYTLSLFDTLGDAVGFERAYWVLIVMPLMPLVLYVLYTVARRYFFAPECHSIKVEKPHHNDMSEAAQQGNIEMESRTGQDAEVKNVLFGVSAGY